MPPFPQSVIDSIQSDSPSTVVREKISMFSRVTLVGSFPTCLVSQFMIWEAVRRGDVGRSPFMEMSPPDLLNDFTTEVSSTTDHCECEGLVHGPAMCPALAIQGLA